MDMSQMSQSDSTKSSMDPNPDLWFFGSSAVWPPVDEQGHPRPVLVACLVVLGTLMWRLFFTRKKSCFWEKWQARKRDILLAQMTAVISHQRTEFDLDKEQVKR